MLIAALFIAALFTYAEAKAQAVVNVLVPSPCQYMVINHVAPIGGCAEIPWLAYSWLVPAGTTTITSPPPPLGMWVVGVDVIEPISGMVASVSGWTAVLPCGGFPAAVPGPFGACLSGGVNYTQGPTSTVNIL